MQNNTCNYIDPYYYDQNNYENNSNKTSQSNFFNWNALQYLEECLKCSSITIEEYNIYLQRYHSYQPTPQQFLEII
jgi:hypothetical protein